jgi:hypothetical protein
MEPNTFTEETNALLELAHELADTLSEREELSIDKEAEALVRASIAAVDFARSAYRAVFAGAKVSSAAHCFLAPARAACDRAVQNLRRRVAGIVAARCMVMSIDDLTNLANSVFARADS